LKKDPTVLGRISFWSFAISNLLSIPFFYLAGKNYAILKNKEKISNLETLTKRITIHEKRLTIQQDRGEYTKQVDIDSEEDTD